MFTIVFWKETADRGIKSGAQAVLLGLGLGEGLNAFAVDWKLAAGFALGGLFLSVLTSLISAPFGDRGNPTLIV
jgi:hypothetical protein